MDYKMIHEIMMTHEMEIRERQLEEQIKEEEERNRNKGLEIATMMVGFLSEHQEYSVSNVINKFFEKYGAEKANKLFELINNHIETIVKSLGSIEKHTPTR